MHLKTKQVNPRASFITQSKKTEKLRMLLSTRKKNRSFTQRNPYIRIYFLSTWNRSLLNCPRGHFSLRESNPLFSFLLSLLPRRFISIWNTAHMFLGGWRFPCPCLVFFNTNPKKCLCFLQLQKFIPKNTDSEKKKN